MDTADIGDTASTAQILAHRQATLPRSGARADVGEDPVGEGITPAASDALSRFVSSLGEAYGDRLADVIVFGSRARGDASHDSDLDVAVLLKDELVDTYKEKMAMADLAYDAIVETGMYVQPWPVSMRHWKEPIGHANPALIEAMRRDGRHSELRP